MRFIVQKKPEKMSSQAFVKHINAIVLRKNHPEKIWVINVMVVLVEDSDFGSGFVDQALYLVAGYWYYCLHYYSCLE